MSARQSIPFGCIPVLRKTILALTVGALTVCIAAWAQPEPAATTDDTILVSPDLLSGTAAASHAGAELTRQFAVSGTHWPRGAGFPDEAIHPPAAIVPSGDNASWELNGVHFVEINRGPADTASGADRAATAHSGGAVWLEEDLRNNVGTSGRPVIVLARGGIDCAPEGCKDSGNAPRENDRRQRLWNALQGYNVVGMFTGNAQTRGVYYFNEFGGHLDSFGAGEDSCLHPGNSACTDRGHFFVVRVTGNFLDVASVAWGGNTDGGAPHFTSLNRASGDGLGGGQPGCRKLIDSRIVDLTSFVDRSALDPAGNTIRIVNSSDKPIPGPLALEFVGLAGDSIDLTNKAFVDRCAEGGNSFMIPDNGPVVSLAPGASLGFTPALSRAVNPAGLAVKLVHYAPAKGAVPAAVNLVRTAQALPPNGSIALYGPPNTPFTVTNTIASGTRNWVAVTARENAFDPFGMATLDYRLNARALADSASGAEVANVKVIPASGERDEVDVAVTLNQLAADSINNIKLTPGTQFNAGTPLAVSAHLQYTPVVDETDGGTYQAKGTMSLVDVTKPASPVTLVTDNINNSCDPDSDPNCPSQPNDTANFPKVTLSPAVHTLKVTYSGDSNYAPTTSSAFQVAAGQPTVTLQSNPSGLTLAIDGKLVVTPLIEQVNLGSRHILMAFSPQTGSGTKYIFDHWENGSPVVSRAITIAQISNIFAAYYDTQYQLTLTASPASSGTIDASPASPSGYYPAGAKLTITANPKAGYYFSGFSGALTGSTNSQTLTLNRPVSVTAIFDPVIAPTIAWPAPRPILAGTALGSTQLDATANVPGTFVYTPPAGTKPPLGNGYKLSTAFTPTSGDYSTVKATNTIDVLAQWGPNLGLTTSAARSDGGSEIALTIHLTNVSSQTITGFKLTRATIGNAAPIAPTPSIANISGYGSESFTLLYHGSAGASGSHQTLTLTGTCSTGALSYTVQTTLP